MTGRGSRPASNLGDRETSPVTVIGIPACPVIPGSTRFVNISFLHLSENILGRVREGGKPSRVGVGGSPPGARPLDGAERPTYSVSAGMICFLRLITPGSTTVSPVTTQPNEASAMRFTRSLGTSSVASSRRMSTTNSST